MMKHKNEQLPKHNNKMRVAKYKENAGSGISNVKGGLLHLHFMKFLSSIVMAIPKI